VRLDCDKNTRFAEVSDSYNNKAAEGGVWMIKDAFTEDLKTG
jgi:hypothetical protein